MPALLDLPPELRLHIYRFAVTEPWAVSIIECSSGRNQATMATAKSLRLVDKQLGAEVIPLYWSCNTFGTYLTSWTTGKAFCSWLEGGVRDVATHIRKLEFAVTTPCSLRREAIQRLNQSTVAHSHNARFCTTIVDVDLGRPWEKAIVIKEDEGCSHPEYHERFGLIASQLLSRDRPLQVTKEMLWSLFEYSRHLTEPHKSRLVIKYDWAVEVYCRCMTK